MNTKISEPVALDVVAEIRIQYHANGSLSISGNIGDITLALAMMDQGREAVKNQYENRNKIIVPSRDVEVVQSTQYPTLPYGDMCEGKISL